jgi:hypothetical protein
MMEHPNLTIYRVPPHLMPSAMEPEDVEREERWHRARRALDLLRASTDAEPPEGDGGIIDWETYREALVELGFYDSLPVRLIVVFKFSTSAETEELEVIVRGLKGLAAALTPLDPSQEELKRVSRGKGPPRAHALVVD